MLITMSSSVAVLWFTTGNPKAVLWSGGFMALVAIWAWRYPGSHDIHAARVAAGKKVAWLS
jgi:hypothetical protein